MRAENCQPENTSRQKHKIKEKTVGRECTTISHAPDRANRQEKKWRAAIENECNKKNKKCKTAEKKTVRLASVVVSIFLDQNVENAS